MAKLTVVVDNRAMKGLKAAWGLSVLIEAYKRILFDTGPDARVLEDNMRRLGITGRFDHLVISHAHWDHAGGMNYALKFSDHICLPEKIGTVGEVCRNPTKIEDFAQTTGVMGLAIREQGLIVHGSEKTALLVGCSHPGIDNLTRRAHQLTEQIDIVIGGFHLGSASRRKIEKIAEVFDKLDVGEVYGIHCTGDEARRIFREKLGDRAKAGYAGLSFEF